MKIWMIKRSTGSGEAAYFAGFGGLFQWRVIESAQIYTRKEDVDQAMTDLGENQRHEIVEFNSKEV